MFRDLVLANRSCRGYDPSRKVTRDELLTFVDLARQTPSGANLQPLCYRIVTDKEEAAAVCAHMRLGAALPELHLPFPGTEPSAFVLICVNSSIVKNPAAAGIDVGIAAQTMLLAAAEAGLGGIMIANFDKQETGELLGIPEYAVPTLLLAFGKSVETIVLEDAKDGTVKYYRDAQGIHHVPKRTMGDILLK